MVALGLVVALALVGCSEKDVGSEDSGASDGGSADGGSADGGTEDGGADGGSEDGGTEDGGADGGTEDGGAEDGGADGGTSDGGAEDADGDGWVAGEGAGEDCDDNDASVHPGAEDLCTDGIDSDCDGWDGTEDCNGEVSGAAWALLTGREAPTTTWISDPGDITGDGQGDIFVGFAEYEHDRGQRCVGGRLVTGPVEGEVDLGGADTVSVGDACYAAGGGDLTGDGYDDVIVTTVDDNEYSTPWVVPGPLPSGGLLSQRWGYSLNFVGREHDVYDHRSTAWLGDLDGDGVDDAVVYWAATLTLYTGPITGPRPTPDAIQDDSTDVSFEDQSIVNAVGLGDLDGDGVGDLGVSWSEHTAMQVYLGPVGESLESFAWDHAVSVSGGTWVGGADLDGDGHDDVVIADNASLFPDRAIHGVATFLGPLPTEVAVDDARLIITGDGDSVEFADSAVLTGDWDGDGAPEIAISDPEVTTWGGAGTGRVTVYSGATEGTLTPDDAIARAGPAVATADLGHALMGGMALAPDGGDTSLLITSRWMPGRLDTGYFLYGMVLRPTAE